MERKVCAGVADQLVLAAGTAAAQRVGLDILVQELGGVELGGVAGHELKLDLVGVGRHPLPDALSQSI